jgi:preprotein translocase subunit SecB
MAEEQAATQQDQPQQQFAMQRIYSKDISFESPSTPGVFTKQWQPKVNVDLNTKSDKIDEKGNYEVVLTITITAKVEEETAFLVEIQQAGIFFITGFEGEVPLCPGGYRCPLCQRRIPAGHAGAGQL